MYCVNQLSKRRVLLTFRWHRRGGHRGGFRDCDPTPQYQNEFRQENNPNQRANRKILEKALWSSEKLMSSIIMTKRKRTATAPT